MLSTLYPIVCLIKLICPYRGRHPPTELGDVAAEVLTALMPSKVRPIRVIPVSGVVLCGVALALGGLQ